MHNSLWADILVAEATMTPPKADQAGNHSEICQKCGPGPIDIKYYRPAAYFYMFCRQCGESWIRPWHAVEAQPKRFPQCANKIRSMRLQNYRATTGVLEQLKHWLFPSTAPWWIRPSKEAA